MLNMNTKNHNDVLDQALGAVNKRYRSKIISSYVELKRNSFEGRHEATGLAAGKLCESVLRLLQERILGGATPFGQQIPNFADECRKLVTAPAATGTESERVVIPRALVFLYTMRSKRGIGHIGGDVDANQVDALTAVAVSDWIVCELIRVFHGLSLEEAQAIVDSLAIRRLPTVWEVAGKKRVLENGLSTKEKTLLLLYSAKETCVLAEDLCEWVEYSNPSAFRNTLLRTLHRERLIEYDRDDELVYLSPKGVELVENRVIPKSI